ncbi:MAG: oligosaccharide flippase family protein, partial [Christensenellales bacterium]
MKKNFRYLFTGAGMLAVCSVIAKLLGAMYRIPLTNILGGEGMGLYQMVFPLYTLLLTVSSGGLPVAISRIIAVKLADDDEAGAAKVLKVSVAALAVIGIAGSLALALFNDSIAAVQGNRDAALAYVGIAPAVALVAVLSCYRGYYQGRENMLPSAVSQLIEQAVKLFLGLYFARLMMPRGVAYGVFGALLGVSASELLAMLSLMLMYA